MFVVTELLFFCAYETKILCGRRSMQCIISQFVVEKKIYNYKSKTKLSLFSALWDFFVITLFWMIRTSWTRRPRTSLRDLSYFKFTLLFWKKTLDLNLLYNLKKLTTRPTPSRFLVITYHIYGYGQKLYLSRPCLLVPGPFSTHSYFCFHHKILRYYAFGLTDPKH